MRARYALPALLIALALASTREARADAWSLDRGEYLTEIQSSLFSANSYYDRDGTRLGFGAPKLEQRMVSWRTQMGWKKRLNLVLGLAGRSVSGFEGPLPAYPTQSGLSDLELRLHYRLANGPRALAIEAGWNGPAGYDRQLSRALGDGRQQLSASVELGSAVGSHGFLELSGGGSYRFHSLRKPDSIANLDPRLTTNVYYDLGAEGGFWLTHALLIGGRYRGRVLATTTAEDVAGNTHGYGRLVLAGKDQIDESVHLAGPMLLYRVDDHLDLVAGSYSTAAGKNTLHYDQFYVTLAFKQSKLKRNQGPAGTAAP